MIMELQTYSFNPSQSKYTIFGFFIKGTVDVTSSYVSVAYPLHNKHVADEGSSKAANSISVTSIFM